MMIKQKALASEDLIEEPDEKDQVWWIAGVNYIKAMAVCDLER